jgi:hypothetical protein
MRSFNIFILCFLFLLAPLIAGADELTRIIQADLQSLGYDTGEANGEMNTETIIAVSKFQAEHDLEVTGEVSPQLAGVIKAAIKDQSAPAVAEAPAVAAPAPADDQAALRAAQQACLQEKIAAQQESQKKKRGFGKLLSAVSRTASRFGGSDLTRAVADTAGAIYDVNATKDDLEGAAKDLGLTEDDLEACRNPAL